MDLLEAIFDKEIIKNNKCKKLKNNQDNQDFLEVILHDENLGGHIDILYRLWLFIIGEKIEVPELFKKLHKLNILLPMLKRNANLLSISNEPEFTKKHIKNKIKTIKTYQTYFE